MGTAPGFFDVDDRLRRLSDLGDQLEAYGPIVDFEAFRPGLEKALVMTIPNSATLFSIAPLPPLRKHLAS
jgi:hypothetical protein